jgi:hypothetical protein
VLNAVQIPQFRALVTAAGEIREFLFPDLCLRIVYLS